jgi:hypothetical protein
MTTVSSADKSRGIGLGADSRSANVEPSGDRAARVRLDRQREIVVVRPRNRLAFAGSEAVCLVPLEKTGIRTNAPSGPQFSAE